MPDLGPLWLSLALASVTTVILLFIGTPLAWWLSGTQSRLSPVIEAVTALPLVLPQPQDRALGLQPKPGLSFGCSRQGSEVAHSGNAARATFPEVHGDGRRLSMPGGEITDPPDVETVSTNTLRQAMGRAVSGLRVVPRKSDEE